MTLFQIAGSSGAGKSTVGKVLKSRGFTVVDTDMDRELSGYVNWKTGLRVNELPPEPYSKKWLEQHSWQWNMERMLQLAEQYRKHRAFLAGSASNLDKFFSFFAMRFWIWADRETIAKRLQSREPERWKEGSFELDCILQQSERSRQWAIREGYTIVFGSQAPEIIADDILAYIDRTYLLP